MTRISTPVFFARYALFAVVPALALFCASGQGGEVSETANEPVAEPAAEPANEPVWLNDYAQAWQKAETDRSMLLIFFRQPGDDNRSAELEKTLADPSLADLFGNFSLLKIAPETAVSLAAGENLPLAPGDMAENAPSILLQRPEFEEMLGQCGLAVIDLTNPDSDEYGLVVSVFPFLDSHHYGLNEVKVMLSLPPGTLTQRTMIYAVRVHPDSPQSTAGELLPVLAAGAESHSAYQAKIRLQGHHFWDRRFQELGRQLPGNLTAQEVCAEGWPWQRLLEAAIDCVHCWRQSPGHWSAVVARQPYYGYDMKKGSNNIWYGTGLFGNRGESAPATDTTSATSATSATSVANTQANTYPRRGRRR